MVRRFIASLVALGLLAASLMAFQFDLFGIKKLVAIRSGSASQTVVNQVVPRALSLVCPGAAFVDGATHGGVSTFNRVGSAQLNINQNSAPSFSSATDSTVLESQAGSNTAQAASVPQGSALLSANQTQLVSATAQGISAGANGLVGADCERPASDFWFLGASTAVGRQSLLIVHNPSPVDATFDLELFDEGGLVTTSATQGLSVLAGKTLVLPLAAFAPSDRTLTIHLSSQGGAVTAWVQQKTVRGTVAAGIDFISASSSSATTQVIAGLTVSGAKAAAAIAKDNPDYSDLAPMVRIFVPSETAPGLKTVNATILVSGIDAKTFGTVVRQTISVGQTTDVPLAGLADGRYSVEVTADRPVFAAARLSSNSSDQAKVLTPTGSDFAWLNAAEPILTPRNFMVPSAGASWLNLVSTNPAVVTLTDAKTGQAKTISLAQSSMVEMPMKAGVDVQISSTTQVFANLINRSGNGIAALNILDAKNLGGKVAVRIQ